MLKNQFSLLTKRRFLPLFITQFLGAFNDNLYKNALVVLITYFLSSKLTTDPQILVTFTGCLLILPMFLFSAQAGSIADKYEKSKLIRIIKVAEIILMLLGCIGFILQNVTMLMIVLFLLGTQATFFGPVKYSILPAHLKDDELVAGNGLIETGTFLAILLGNILGVIFITLPHGLIIISTVIVLISVLGFLSSCFIPKAKAAAPLLKLSLNFVKETWDIVKFTSKTRSIFLCILGISWFWLIGFTFLAEFPNYAKDFIGANEDVFVLFLAIFSVGVGIGSSLCNRLLKGQIEATYVPLAALAISLFTFDLYFATLLETHASQGAALLTLHEFVQSPNHWRIMLDMLLIATAAGIYIVPLYAIMQHIAEESHKARVIASNNIMNALFMTVAAIATMIMLKLKLTIPQIFLTIGLVNLIVVVQSCRLLPGFLVKSILRLILQLVYRVEVIGLENFRKAGSRVVIAPNHTSFLDGLLLAAFLPDKLSFAMYGGYANKWWVKPITMFIEIFGLEPTNPYVLKSIIKYVKEDKKLVIFPEGRITVTGALMKIYEGPGLIADKADAMVLPILIQGAQYSPFSRLRGRVRLRWFPKITLTIFEPQQLKVDEEVRGRRRRQVMGDKMYQIMSNIMFLGTHLDTTLFQSLIEAKNIHGAKHKIIEDIKREPLSYKKLILGSLVLGRKLSKMTKRGEAVGILMPNVVATIVTFFGLQAYLRVAALINFSTGTQNVVLASLTAKLKIVCTSRAFVETAKLQGMIKALEDKSIQIIYLEDIKSQVGFFDKLHALFSSKLPWAYGISQKYAYANNPAVILFTSGSEGTPKAVVLSHRNLHANKGQLSSRVDFSPADIVLNALPMFHSFGLTAGTILPILYGMKVFFYPSPLHYRIIPELSYDINATILFGTNTFLTGYARFANAYDFYSIRYVYAGAEKLKEENRRLWADKFGVRIFEGYGATETSPVISANTPMHNKPGSVGKFMPGIEFNISPVPDITDGGRLSVKGPNIMLGYMFYDNPGVLVPPDEGWYDTGDIVTLDNEGYITIQGRAKRFAKIGGEMVSLAFVEHYLDKLWPHAMHAVITIPDEKKGEQLLLVTTHEHADRSEIIQYARQNGISELAVPKAIKILHKIPLLGSGKVDYAGINELLKELKG
ncbi:MAG: acyl-[ACP]--phospholipid O-acyltransferase [Gammaproteobacteria bacterium]|nr:acyl-[ACP]--phospholipid O-acyltransferase [Gammaproteobacteria bacterium]